MKTILIAAEEPRTQRLVQINLQRWGYGVFQAMTGNDALTQVETQRPDLVVLNMTLPDMDGYEFLARLKGSEYGRTLPILALTLTAQDSAFWHEEWNANGAWLNKPYRSAELVSLAGRLLCAVEEVYDHTSEGLRRIFALYHTRSKFLCPMCKAELIIALDGEACRRHRVHSGIYCPRNLNHVAVMVELKSARDAWRERLDGLNPLEAEPREDNTEL